MADLTIKRLTAGWPKLFSYDKDNNAAATYYSQTDPNSAINTRDSFFYKKKGWDIFTYAMCIGKTLGPQVPINVSSQSNSIPLDYVDEWHVAAMLSIVMSEKGINLSIFDTPTKIRQICEQYANAGIDKLMEIDKDKFKDSSNERFGDILETFLNK